MPSFLDRPAKSSSVKSFNLDACVVPSHSIKYHCTSIALFKLSCRLHPAMVKLTEVEDEHFSEKPATTKDDVLLAEDEDEDYTDTGTAPLSFPESLERPRKAVWRKLSCHDNLPNGISSSPAPFLRWSSRLETNSLNLPNRIAQLG